MLSGNDVKCKQLAAGALWNLARDDSLKQPIAGAGAVAPLVAMLRVDDPECKQLAAGALLSLACDDSLRQPIANAGALGPLVAMLSGNDVKCKREAAGALRNLACDGSLRQPIAGAGAVAPLVAMLSSNDVKCKQDAAGLLWHLAFDDSLKQPIADAGAVAPLVAMLRGDDIECKRRASGALRHLCRKGDVVFGNAVPALVASLGSSNEEVRTNCSKALQGLQLSKFEHLLTGTIQQLRAIITAASSQPEGEAVTALATTHLRDVRLKRGEIGRALSFGLSRCANAGVCDITGVGVMFSCGLADDDPTPAQLARPEFRSQLEPMLVQILSSTGGDSSSNGGGGGGSSSSSPTSRSPSMQVQAANAMGHVLDVAASEEAETQMAESQRGSDSEEMEIEVAASEAGGVVLLVPPTGWEDHSRMLEDDRLADLKFKVGVVHTKHVPNPSCC
jgi:hypothetical protein